MEYRDIGKTGIRASVLGMGCMRLPTVGDNNNIDQKEAVRLIRYAIDSGVTYLDTAYNYHGGNSEVIVGEALKDGYRNRVTLVTKAPSWLIKEPGDFEKHLDEQLNKLQVESIDIYLLHSMNQGFWTNYKKLNIFSEIESVKKKGKIKHIGFSFHDTYTVFEDILTAYPWDVCMLQFNYMDVNEQAGLKGMELAGKMGVPVIVMEPLKGGLLSNPPSDIQTIWDQSAKGWSPVQWALHFIANHPQVSVVLSGMSTEEQVKDNVRIARELTLNTMTVEDFRLVEQVRDAYESKVKVACTSCEYCMPCPHGVAIPSVFSYYNRAHIYSSPQMVKQNYYGFVKEEQKAGKCLACGVCLDKCPQKIHIIEALKEVKDYFGA